MMGSLCDGLMGFVIVSSVIVTTYGDVEDPTVPLPGCRHDVGS